MTMSMQQRLSLWHKILADYARGLIDGRKWLHNLKKEANPLQIFHLVKKNKPSMCEDGVAQ